VGPVTQLSIKLPVNIVKSIRASMKRRVNVVEMFSYPVCAKLAVQVIAVLLSPSSCPVTINIVGEIIHNQTVHTVSVVVPK
jgi:hypothetical protein